MRIAFGFYLIYFAVVVALFNFVAHKITGG